MVMGWNELGDVTVECRQNGVDASQTGRRLFEKCPGHDSGSVVEAFAGAGFPVRETVIGAMEYSTHEIVAKAREIGFPQEEVDAVVAEAWHE